jgi:hypothetical protein
MSLYKLVGVGAIRARMLLAKRSIRKALQAALYEHGMFIMTHTLPITPLDRGDLRASWFVTPENGASGPVVRIGFAISYAEKVHEMLDANFQEPGTQAKFLEETLSKYRGRLQTRLVAVANTALKKGR